MTLLKPKEVAERLRINESSVYRMVNDGRLGSYIINYGTIRISEDDLDEYLRSRRMPALKKEKRRLGDPAIATQS